MSDLQLERMALGELPEDELNQARLKELKDSNQEILETYPPEEVVVRIRERAERRAKKKRQRTVLRLAIAVPVAAALLLGVILVMPDQPQLSAGRDQPEVTREKGPSQAYLRIYLKQGSQSVLLSRESRVRTRDLLQMSYVASGARFGDRASHRSMFSANVRPVTVRQSSRSKSGLPRASEPRIV